ncbi:response regulator [Salinicola salarius]|uniref:response regulator n=2 Tax=Salinicola salarius TaxID=430457 RepID=UPI000DA17D2E|nr:response regulator [Salinicola salarius]MDF3917623.1 response regulator [Salinicola salarius]
MISRWLVIFFLLFSSLLLGLAGWHAWEWRRANDQMLSRRLQSINRVFTPSLAEAAQNEDMARVHELLARLTSDPAIVNATLRDESGNVRDFTGAIPSSMPLEALPSALHTGNHEGIQRWIQPLETFVVPQSSHRYWLDLSLDPLRASAVPDRPFFGPWMSLLALVPLFALALTWRRSRHLGRTRRGRTASDTRSPLFPASSLAHASAVSADDDLAYVSHELRAPLSGVLGFCRLLENSPLDAQQREWLRHIHLASTGLLDTVDHVLGDNRGRADNVFDISEVLWEILCLQTPLAQAKRMTLLATVYDDVPPRLVGADIGIRQLLTNLINNAIKYGEEGDIVIRVVLESREGSAVRLRLSVSDGGSRDPSHRQRLKRALERGRAKAVDGKTGMGIAICQRLAAEMNGSLALGARSGKGNTVIASIGLEACEPYVRPAEFDLEGAEIAIWQPHARLAYRLDYALKRWRARPKSLSEPDSLSATGDTSQLSIIGIDEKALEPEAHRIWQQRFDAMRRPCLLMANLAPTRPITWRLPEGSTILRLPISRYSLGRALARMLAEHRQRDFPPRPRVLVIDDDEVSQHYLDTVLTAIGAEVVAARNAAEAVALASELTIDLVLVDLHLPDASGFEATHRLRRSNREWEGKPVIAMTAEPNAHQRGRSTDDIDEILIKPLEESLLRSVLARYLTMPLPPPSPSPSQQMLSASDTDVPRTPPPLHAGDLPVVDKAQARRINGDREVLAEEMLALLIADLPRYRRELNAAWHHRDTEQLAEIAHQLGGGCCYCGALQLAAACETLESRARRHPLDACGEAFREVMTACDRLVIWADDQTATNIH